MSVIDTIVLLCFGGILLCSIFLIVSFGKIARHENKIAQHSGEGFRLNRPFWLAVFLVINATAMAGISALRVVDGIQNRQISSTQPWILAIGLILLWVAKTGFHWAATLENGKWSWRLYVALVVVWTVFIVWSYAPILPR